MLEMIMDKKLLFVLMGIFAGIGVADKCVVSMTMKRLVQAAGNMSKSTHPLMRLVRAKFEHACMVSDTVENVGVFVDKYLYEYKICGLPLHTLRRLEKICAGLCGLTGLAGAFFSYRLYGMGDAVLRLGACGVGLGILVWLFHLTTDEEYGLQMAKNYMVDYLENVCLHKFEKTNGKERAGRQRIAGNLAGSKRANQENDTDTEEASGEVNEDMQYIGDYDKADEKMEYMDGYDKVGRKAVYAGDYDESRETRYAQEPDIDDNIEKQLVSENSKTGKIAAIEAMAPVTTERRGSRSKRSKRKKEPTREVARNLERATAKLAEATKSGRQYEEYEEAEAAEKGRRYEEYEEAEATEKGRRYEEYEEAETAENRKRYMEYEESGLAGSRKKYAQYTTEEASDDDEKNENQSAIRKTAGGSKQMPVQNTSRGSIPAPAQSSAYEPGPDTDQAPEIPPDIEKELPKEEMIRQILQEFMA